jgi:hypothetical protein
VHAAFISEFALARLQMDRIKRQFQLLDVSMTGTIDHSDLRHVLQVLDEETWTRKNIDALMAAMDTDKNGHIQYNEFLDFISGGADAGETPVFFTDVEEASLESGLRDTQVNIAIYTNVAPPGVPPKRTAVDGRAEILTALRTFCSIPPEHKIIVTVKLDESSSMEPQKGIKTFRQMSKHIQGPRNGEVCLRDGVAYGKGLGCDDPVRVDLKVTSHLDAYGVFQESGGEPNHWSDWSITLYLQLDGSFCVCVDSSKYQKHDSATDCKLDQTISRCENLDDSTTNSESGVAYRCIIKGAWTTADNRLELAAVNGHASTKRDVDVIPTEEDWPCDENFTLRCAVDVNSGRVASVDGLRDAFEKFLKL